MRFNLKKTYSIFASSFLVALVFAVPSQAFGQSLDSRYCPNPTTDFFKGSIHYENGAPWIETVVDPDFEQKVLRGERKIGGDIPLTPVYDLVVRIKPEFNYYCIPGWEGQAFPVTANMLPPFLHVTAAIVVGTKDEPVTDPVVFSRTDKQDEQGRFIYERKIKGWQKGIASGAKLERLIDEIDKGQWLTAQEMGNVSVVNVLVEIKKPVGDAEKIKSPVSFSLCTPLWGIGGNKIIAMFNTHSIDYSKRVSYFENIRLNGFAKISPLKENQGFFSYYIDLRNRITGDNPSMALNEARMKNLGQEGLKGLTIIPYTHELASSVRQEFIGSSSCGKDGTLLLTISEIYKQGWAVTHSSFRGAIISANQSPEVYVHEFGHTFARLNDEYEYDDEEPDTAPISTTNCSLNPELDYKLGNKWYGSDIYEGCSFRYRVGTDKIKKYFKRPSMTSLMDRLGGNGLFNVVSCGYMMSAIKGGDAHSYFPECSKMNGIMKDGVTAQMRLPQLFAWFSNLLSSPTSLMAQVGSSGTPVSSSSNPPSYLIVESFDPADPWGTIVEVTPDATCQTAGGCTLPDLGLYSDKLAALKKSVTQALNILLQKRSAARAGATGGQALQGDPRIDRPLYALQKMSTYLETDSDGNLMTGAALDKFFVYLKYLRSYNDSAFAEVISNAENFIGFSYLFPPSPDKPMLVYIPGAGGDPHWRGGMSLLQGEAQNFNIVGYTFDATVPSSQMVDNLTNEFQTQGLNNSEHVLLMMSLGNTLVHSSILKTVSDQSGVFSNSHVVSVGFLPGGSSKFLGKPTFIPSLAGAVFPPYAEIFNMMNPNNQEQSNIIGRLADISAATKGISYIQANNDDHVDRASTATTYATNRNLFFGQMSGQIQYVSPPLIYKKNNPHVNLLYAPEVKKKIDSFLPLLTPSSP